MIEIKSKLRRWGNSFGIIVPQTAILDGNLKEGDEISIIMKSDKGDMKQVFGKLKNWKIDSQKFKDEVRKEEKKCRVTF